jgi:hypothetical protein
MKIELIKDNGNHKAGVVSNLPDRYANILIDKCIAKKFEEVKIVENVQETTLFESNKDESLQQKNGKMK